jgi:hypothetical protein
MSKFLRIAFGIVPPRIAGAAVAAYFGQYQVAAALLASEQQSRARKKREARQRNAYNSSLKDRLVMLDASPSAARRIVLGRCRLGGHALRRPFSTGTNKERLTMLLEFAGHEIDAYETWYADDTALTLDSNGWVQTAPWFKGRTESWVQLGNLDGSGGASVSLTYTPLGAVLATWSTGSGDSSDHGSLTVSVTGSTATLSGGPSGATYGLTYQYTVGTSLMRIRPYLGTAGQSVGTDLSGEYTGDMRSTDHYRGIALAVVDVLYDQDVFTTGAPSISAVLRGAKVLDTRTSVTAWSQNPALLAHHYARHANGFALPSDLIDIDDVNAAATACDVSTDFTLRKPDTSTEVVTLPRHRAAIVVPTDADPRGMFAELVEAMGGQWGWAGGKLRMRAAAMAASAGTLDQGWIWRSAGARSEPDVRITNGVPREAKRNAISGVCVDPAQRYQVLPFPPIRDAVLIAAEGEYPEEVELSAVNHVAHAQHLASLMIRQSQAGLRMEVQCGLAGYRCELFDVLQVTLPRYGMVAKTFEVIGWRWHPTDGARLTLAEITADMFTPLAELTGRDPAPNSSLPAPWDVEDITGLAVDSNVAAMADGSIVTRLVVTWTQATTTSILSGGQIEVQYRPVGGDWASWMEQGSSTQAIIPGVLAGRAYVVRVRAVQLVPYVRGDWGAQVVEILAAAPLVTTGGLAANAATTIAYQSGNEGGTGYGTYDVVTFDVTPEVDCWIEFTGGMTANNCVGDSGFSIAWRVTPDGGSTTSLGGSDSNTTARTQFAIASAFEADAGVQLVFTLRTTRPGTTPSINVWAWSARVAMIKR